MRTVGRCRSLFTIWAVIDSTARRWLSSSRPSSPSAFRSSASRISSARARSEAIAGTTSSAACHSWNFSASAATIASARSASPRPLDRRRVEDVASAARRGDDDVRLLELPADLLERDRLRSQPLRELLRPVERPVRDERDPCLPRQQVPGGLLADLAGPDEEDRAAREVAEHLLGERRGRSRDRRWALPDRRLRAHLPPRVERLAEQPVEQRRGRPRLERGPHLAEDLALARHERVEAGGDPEEVQCRGVIV